MEGEQISPLVFVERSAVATDLGQLLELPFAGVTRCEQHEHRNRNVRRIPEGVDASRWHVKEPAFIHLGPGLAVEEIYASVGLRAPVSVELAPRSVKIVWEGLSGAIMAPVSTQANESSASFLEPVAS